MARTDCRSSTTPSRLVCCIPCGTVREPHLEPTAKRDAPRGRPLECRAAGGRVWGRDRRVPEGGPGAAARVTNACCPGAPRLSALSRRTTSSGPGSRASPSGSCAGRPIEVIALPVASHDWFRHDQDLLPVRLEASDVSRRSDTQSRVEHRNDCGVSCWVRDRGAATMSNRRQ